MAARKFNTYSIWTQSPHWNCPCESTPVAISEQSWTSFGSTSSSCIVKSENNTTRFSSTRTIRPVSPSYRPASTFTWSPCLKYFFSSLAWNSSGSWNKKKCIVAATQHNKQKHHMGQKLCLQNCFISTQGSSDKCGIGKNNL